MAGAFDRDTAPTQSVQQSTDPFSMATGGNKDPFYFSTGKRKDVTVNGVVYKNAIDVGSTRPPAAEGIGSISPATGLKITGDERDYGKELEARAIGYTPEYIASRGGINSQGYFNDTPLNGQLTASERKSVTNPNGSINTAAMWAILNQKQGGKLGAYPGDSVAQEKINALTGGAGGAGGVGGSTSGSLVGGPGTPEQQEARRSAYDLLYEQFNQYGLGSLVDGIKGLIQENVSPSEFAIRLRQTDAYKKRFAANAQRIAQGLAAIDEATYIGLEDQYQEIMRQYGLPSSYYAKGEMGRQEGFEKFIASDISASELEDRIMTAQNRVINANPEVAKALKEFYPDITNGDILAYTLDPKNAIKNIQRKVTAAEIGGAAMAQGLQTGLTRAEELAGYGVDKAAAQQGFATVAQVAPRGGQLAEIYKQDPYTQQTAEQEVFNLAGSAQAAQKRKKLTELETAAFSGKSGLGALARDRAGAL